MSNFKILSEKEIESELSKLSEWKVKDDFLTATFKFNSFRDAIALINMVAIEAEVINHHPRYTHNYKTVEFKLNTHDAKGKISDLDIKLAKYISSVYKKY